ncbi:MAG: SDR family oxidoreductase [Acidobacteriota bacterium]
MKIPGPVLITGGSRGIGRALVEALVARHVPVAFTYQTSRAAADELVATSEGRAHAYQFDLSERERTAGLVEEIEATVGPLWGLVNNAAVRRDGLMALASDSDWQATMDANVDGPFRLTRAVLKTMMPRRKGAIVMISSLTAIHGVAGQTAYGASKAALLGMTRSLARECGKRNLRVNALVPGFVLTEMTSQLSAEQIKLLRAPECLPSGVTPEMVADAALFLLSTAAAGITGQTIVVDAGTSA